MIAEVEGWIYPDGNEKSTYPRPSASDDLVMPQTVRGLFRMEDIEVDGRLKSNRDYAARLAASSPQTPQAKKTPDWDTFELPREFFQWHDHIVVDDKPESDYPSLSHSMAAPSSVQDLPQQREPYSDPRPPPAAPPEFINPETHLWKYWTSYLVNSPLDPVSGSRSAVLGDLLVFPGKVDDVLGSVDPWDVSLNQDPPFYRAAFMTPPYISGMPDAHIVMGNMETDNSGNGWRE